MSLSFYITAMKINKLIYLFLVLALPIGIFLFLKYFGENKFEVEPLFSKGVTVSDPTCNNPSSGQYTIPVKMLDRLNWYETDSLTLFYFAAERNKSNNPFNRIADNFTADELNLIQVLPSANQDSVPPSTLQLVLIQKDYLTHWKKCFFFIQEPYDLLLVDRARRIRGFYQLENREEIDRLIVEANIILKKY